MVLSDQLSADPCAAIWRKSAECDTRAARHLVERTEMPQIGDVALSH